MAGFDKYTYRDTDIGRVRSSGDVAPMARVDAASTTDENKRYYANADQLGPNAAFDELTRIKLASRGRYEYLNNSFCRGSLQSLAYDLIGCGPRLQLTLPGDDDGNVAKGIERSHHKWARRAMLGMKYRLMELGAGRCGGMFGLLDTNEALKNPVKLDLRLVEIDQCRTPYGTADPQVVSGIRVNGRGDPVEYYFLRYHPGDLAATGMVPYGSKADFLNVPASQVLHWREIERPGQLHGIPRITSALPNFGQLRRIRLATLTAMEFAAMLAGVLKTNLPPDGNVTAVENWSLFELVRGALLSLPQGWEASQFESKHPNATFESVNDSILGENGRGVGQPRNIILGSSKDLNFASGRLDLLPYHRRMEVIRDDFRTIVADPVLEAWEVEARMVGEVPPLAPPIDQWEWEWLWDRFDSIDPVKDAMADDIRIKNGTKTLAEIVGDSDAHLDQLQREKAAAEARSLPWPLLFNAPTQSTALTAPADQAPSGDPTDAENAVAMALDAVGATEQQISDVMDHLRASNYTRYNGRNGHAYQGGRA